MKKKTEKPGGQQAAAQKQKTMSPDFGQDDYRKFPASLAVYAQQAARTRGRLHKEEESKKRTAFQRDRDRIIHSRAFRRLKGKAQVFMDPPGDHYRTRLTHTLEVAQIARTLARFFHLDEDLCECIALAHDLGHPPFGHIGEKLLKGLDAGAAFDHNAHSLRLVTLIEERHPAYDGLNLSWETLEGLIKHNGPLKKRATALHWYIRAYDLQHRLDLHQQGSLEAQCAAIADDIAYNCHDIDDAYRAGLVDADALSEVPIFKDRLDEARARFPGGAENRLIAVAVSQSLGYLVDDVCAYSQARIAEMQPASSVDIRAFPRALIDFSPDACARLDGLRRFLQTEVYASDAVRRPMHLVEDVVRSLYAHFKQQPEALPEGWKAKAQSDPGLLAVDYIAGMTDAYALLVYEKITGRCVRGMLRAMYASE